jgi:hypothetical protein
LLVWIRATVALGKTTPTTATSLRNRDVEHTKVEERWSERVRKEEKRARELG